MSHDKPRKNFDTRRGSDVFEGDIMVTRVGDVFAIGRLKADREAQEPLGKHRSRAGALKLACALAGANHRVFLSAKASQLTYRPCDCAEILLVAHTGEGLPSRNRRSSAAISSPEPN